MSGMQKSGVNHPHRYLHMSPPDVEAIIDFAATRHNVEVTVTVKLEGDDLTVEVKAGPDCTYLLSECVDVSHEVEPIDFSEDSEEDFSSILRDTETSAEQADYQHHYEHGQWWVVSTLSGESWSVVEEHDEDGSPRVGFELISEGEE